MSVGALPPQQIARVRMLSRPAIESVRFFHGGPRGLAVGDHILPAAEVGHARSVDGPVPIEGIEDAAWVHVTTDRDLAVTYASTIAGGGCLYEVAPPWPLRVNHDSVRPDISFRCLRAEIIAIHEISPDETARRARAVRRLDAPFREAARRQARAS